MNEIERGSLDGRFIYRQYHNSFFPFFYIPTNIPHQPIIESNETPPTYSIDNNHKIVDFRSHISSIHESRESFLLRCSLKKEKEKTGPLVQRNPIPPQKIVRARPSRALSRLPSRGAYWRGLQARLKSSRRWWRRDVGCARPCSPPSRPAARGWG